MSRVRGENTFYFKFPRGVLNDPKATFEKIYEEKFDLLWLKIEKKKVIKNRITDTLKTKTDLQLKAFHGTVESIFLQPLKLKSR